MGGTKGTTGYTNIKNIVNRNDLVPKVAPSDMGFCRYGEDIMVPYYETVATEYDTARTKMLAQLAAVNSGVVFDDSFNTATIEYMRYIYDMALFKVFENYAGVNFGSPQFVYKDRTSVYKQQWEYLDKFLEKFEYYSLKYRSGFSSTREFYSTGEPWSFETTPTFEDSLRYLVSWLMSMSGDKKSRITSGLITAFSSLPVSDSSDLSLNDIYMDVIGDWAKLRDGQKKDIMGQIQDLICDENSPAGKEMTQTERDKLREILPSILTPLFYFVNGDYDNEQQRILGTLAYNANSIMQAHYPEICMAWLRTDDSFYKDEAARFPVEQAEETTVEAPVPSVEPGLYNVDSMSTTLSTNTASAVIYYTTDGTDPQTSDTAVLYNSESINMVYRQYGYTIKAYAKTYKQTSETVTLCYNLAGTSKYKVYMGGSPSWVSVGSYYPTQQVVLSAPSKTGHVFKEWQLSSDDGTSSSEVTAECLGNNKTNNIVSFNMPRRNVYVTLCYTPVITSIDLSVTAPRIGEVVGCGAEWSLKKGSQIYCSDGWSGDTSQAVSTNNNRVPADWNNLITKGKNVVTIYLDPTNMFGNRVLSEDQLPVKFSQDVQVTVNGETATASFDGNTLVVTKEFVPKLTQDVSTTVSVGGETGTTAAELVAKLPTKVIGTTDMGDVWIEISGWRIDNFDSSNAGEYTATGTLTADESKFSFNGHPTTITATVALTQGAVLAPTADVASGDYTQAKSVTLTGEAGAAIYYTLDGSEPSSTSSEYSEAISLTGTVGESKIYDLKAIAIKNGVSSAVSEYTYEIAIPEPKVTLTVESFDINPAYSQTFETYEYQYKAGDTISVTAPDETANNESFAGWSVNGSGGSIITDTNAKNRTINFTMPDTTITLVANYIPVVSKVAITLDEPEAGKPLKTTVNSCKATVTVENDVDSSYLNVV